MYLSTPLICTELFYPCSFNALYAKILIQLGSLYRRDYLHYCRDYGIRTWKGINIHVNSGLNYSSMSKLQQWFSSTAVEARAFMSNSTPHDSVDAINYPCPTPVISKWDPCWCCWADSVIYMYIYISRSVDITSFVYVYRCWYFQYSARFILSLNTFEI